jgi:hypothetical protein
VLLKTGGRRSWLNIRLESGSVCRWNQQVGRKTAPFGKSMREI